MEGSPNSKTEETSPNSSKTESSEQPNPSSEVEVIEAEFKTLAVPAPSSPPLTESRKTKYINDLAAICDIDLDEAKRILELNNWDVQDGIDHHIASLAEDEDMDEDSDDDQGVEILSGPPIVSEGEERSGSGQEPSSLRPSSSADNEDELGACGGEPESSRAGSSTNITSPETTKEHDVEVEMPAPLTPSGTSYSSWAPEQFSIISWNVDGLDEKNLEKRMAAVVDLINTEKHGVVFLQELLPHTFQYIAQRLSADYFPVVGTDNPKSEYFTATFLRRHQVYFEDYFLVPYPGTAMDRKLLVTKAFIGRAKLALLNTHLESTGAFAKERTSQLKQCFELCSTFPPEYNIIFGGDLNLRDAEVQGNLPSNMTDLWIKCGSRPTCQYTWDLTRNKNLQMPGKYQPRCRFDRLYYRESVPLTLNPEFFGVTGIERVVGTQSFPSDHWAIISFFRLEKEARKPLGKKRKAETD